MGHGQLDRLGERDERREAGPGQEPHPAGLESPRIVVGQRRGAGDRSTRQQAAPHQDLEPVADAQDQSAAVVKPAQGVAQNDPEPGRQDPAGAQVVAIGEAAGNRQDLETIEVRWRLDQAIDVPGFDRGPGPLPGIGRFLVAVGSGSTQDDRARASHGVFLRSSVCARSIR